MAQNKSLSTQEVADILHVSKSTIYDLIRKGEIHSYKIGRKVRFTQDDVDAYIARSRHEHSTRPVKNIDTHSTLLTPDVTEEPPLIISGQDVVLDILANYLQQAGVYAARTYLSSFEGLLSLYECKLSDAGILCQKRQSKADQGLVGPAAGGYLCSEPTGRLQCQNSAGYPVETAGYSGGIRPGL